MLSYSIFVLLVGAALAPGATGARVLVAFPMPSRSHSILGHGVVRHLLEGGHQVVHMTAFPRKESVPGLTELSLEALMLDFKKQVQEYDDFKLGNLVGKSNIDEIAFYFFAYEVHRKIFEEKVVLDLLNNPKEKFDAVVAEWFFSNSLAGLAPVLQCPLVLLGSTEAHWQTLRLVDEIPNPAYSVEIFSSDRPPLTFWQRVHELISLIKKYAFISFVIKPLDQSVHNEVYTKIAANRGVPVPDYEESVYNASMLLLNSHPSIGIPYRLPQSARYVGGYHIDTHVKPLPKDLQKIMDEVKNGVIYFSMGSNLKSSDLSDAMKRDILAMFAKLKQTVLWKFEADLQDIPSNVHLLKWAPQQSILSHPNLKLFITHGGLLSTMEAVHYGIPVIGIPVMGDQYVNMKAVESKGFGIMVKLTNEVVVNLEAAIKQMLENPTYKVKAKELSAIFHHRPVPPGKELVHWVEHVIRTGGAPHLRSPALLVPWYQKLFLDLLALVTIAVILCIVSICAVCKRIRRKPKSQKKVKTK